MVSTMISIPSRNSASVIVKAGENLIIVGFICLATKPLSFSLYDTFLASKESEIM